MPFFIFLLLPLFAKPDAKTIDDEWLKLLHFETSFLGESKSRAHNDQFFVSKSHRAEDELESFLQKWDEKPVNDQHVICRFPLRAKYLVSKGYKKFPSSYSCPLLERFHSAFDAIGVSLIFSSYFLDSPASTFGHTFLRIRRDHGKNYNEDQNELLDHGISFAANPTTDNPLLYTILGLSGGFDGIFSAVSYSHKVREYNDSESRDLWSYNLNLTKEEIHRLIDHLWELGQAKLPYYYLSENCSYYILEVLEIATGRELLKDLPPWIIPADTLQAIMREKDFVTSIEYRPSLKTIFYQRQYGMSSEKIERIKSLTLDSSWTVQDLDVGIDYIDLQYRGDEAKALKEPLLRERAKRQEKSRPLNIVRPKPPHEIHPSARFLIANGRTKAKSFMDIEQRFAYFDFLDPYGSKPPHSEIVFFDIGLRLQEDENIRLQKFDLVRAQIRNPLDHWFLPVSYSFALGQGRDSLLCDSCSFIYTYLDSGYNLQFTSASSVYLAFFFKPRFNSDFRKGQSLAVGPYLEWIHLLTDDLRFSYQLRWHEDVNTPNDFLEQMGQLQWDIKEDWALRATYKQKKWKSEKEKAHWEGRLSINFYY